MTSTVEDIKAVNPGLYCVTVTNGCNSTNTCIQLNACSSFGVNLVSKANNCTEFMIGAININVSGGNIPYSYLWSNGATTKNLSGLAGGQYTVTVTDFGKCSRTVSATINTTPAIVTYTSVPCARHVRCGSVIKPPDIIPLSAGAYTDCNTYSLYCDYTFSVVGVGRHVIDDNIFDSYECTLICYGGNPTYGESSSDVLNDKDFNSLKCFYSGGCVFTNLAINGEVYAEFIILGELDLNNYELMDRTSEDCPYNSECCLGIYKCRETGVIPI
jgi:hypothetical protein